MVELTVEQDVERWKRELIAAGWMALTSITWRDPEGRLWRGPYGAWKELQRRKESQ